MNRSAIIMTTEPLMKSTFCSGSRSCRSYKIRPQWKERQTCRFFRRGPESIKVLTNPITKTGYLDNDRYSEDFSLYCG